MNKEPDNINELSVKQRILARLPKPVERAHPWRRRLAILSVFAGGFLLLLWLDIESMQLRYRYIEDEPEGLLKHAVYSFRDWAHAVPIGAIWIAILLTDERRKRWTIIGVAAVAQLYAAIGYNSGKYLISRYRPRDAIREVGPLHEMDVGDTWIGWEPKAKKTGYQSFPSGHTGAAFAQAAALSWFYPPLAPLFWTLATGCALSRYIDAVHWLSDCWVGAFIGYYAAWLALRPWAWKRFFIQFRREKNAPRAAT
jgi:membrane-associated phospholipid phosphatase